MVMIAVESWKKVMEHVVLEANGVGQVRLPRDLRFLFDSNYLFHK